MDRSDVERIVENVLRGLSLEEQSSYGSDYRTIIMTLGDREITRVTIKVSDNMNSQIN